ncbi:hypothetical protein, partial [Pseudomonas aeruginosa]|uniref:hypothetical protein n=1 Tax=Pseudomonas aeruginosa TaxID=287 RepID=UPI0034E05967
MSDVPANQLFDAYFTAAPMRAVFSDRGRLQGMLDFEAALARAEGAHLRREHLGLDQAADGGVQADDGQRQD